MKSRWARAVAQATWVSGDCGGRSWPSLGADSQSAVTSVFRVSHCLPSSPNREGMARSAVLRLRPEIATPAATAAAAAIPAAGATNLAQELSTSPFPLIPGSRYTTTVVADDIARIMAAEPMRLAPTPPSRWIRIGRAEQYQSSPTLAKIARRLVPRATWLHQACTSKVNAVTRSAATAIVRTIVAMRRAVALQGTSAQGLRDESGSSDATARAVGGGS